MSKLTRFLFGKEKYIWFNQRSSANANSFYWCGAVSVILAIIILSIEVIKSVQEMMITGIMPIMPFEVIIPFAGIFGIGLICELAHHLLIIRDRIERVEHDLDLKVMEERK